MVYLIIFGNLLAAVVISFVLAKLIRFIPSVRKSQEIALYNEIIENSSDEIDKRPPLVDFTDSDDAYLFETVKLLVKHEPSHAATIVITLEPHLSQLRKDMLELGEDAARAFHKSAEDCMEYIMTVAPISWVADLWKEAGHKRDQIWLFEYLFKNKVKPILLHQEFSDRISAECKQEILFFRASRKEYNTLKSTKRILIANQFLNEVNQHSISAIYSIVPPTRWRSWTRDAETAQIAYSESLLGESRRNIGILMKQKTDLIIREELSR